MQSVVYTARRGDGHLWMIAFGFSLLVNAGLILLVGLGTLKSTILTVNLGSDQAPPPPPTEPVAMIFPELAEKRVPVVPVPAAEKHFTRTSADQAAPPEEKNTLFFGERDTRATSDRPPVAAAPPLPSQAGINPEDKEIETTESRYQDGSLTANSVTPPEINPLPTPPVPDVPPPVEPAPAAEKASMEKPEVPGTDAERSVAAPREKLLEGPNSVDVQVPRETSKQENIKPTPEKHPPAEEPPPPSPKKPANEPKIADLPKPKPPPDPAFKGFQRKTAIVGSISRTGKSALDVVDSPRGRYEAALSRAVELEFQRNCMRHRDYITPGFLTVRFFVDTNGKVRSVRFDGEMSSGEIQKGFTLNSIRNAEIPPMPPALRKEYANEPLELIFRFYF